MHRNEASLAGGPYSKLHFYYESNTRAMTGDNCHTAGHPAAPSRLKCPDLPPVFSQRAISPITMLRSFDLHMS